MTPTPIGVETPRRNTSNHTPGLRHAKFATEPPRMRLITHKTAGVSSPTVR